MEMSHKEEHQVTLKGWLIQQLRHINLFYPLSYSHAEHIVVTIDEQLIH